MKKLVTFIISFVVLTTTFGISFAKDISVGYVLVGPSNDGGWSMRHSDGFKSLVKHGYEVEGVESVPEADSERVFKKLARKHDIVFATSFGYMEPMVRASAKNKKTIFIDKSEQEFNEEVAAQTVTMTEEVTTHPESFIAGLRRMITLSFEETELKVTRSISANGDNPNLLISKEHYKIGSHFDDKDNHFIRALRLMEQEFSGIAIKFKRVKPKAGYWAIKEISW